jgi:hypothetical protein
MRGWIAFPKISASWFLLALPLVLALGGCRSHLVQTTVVNDGTDPLQNIEVDYPSASFGISSLPPGGRFPYHFQVQGAGPLHLQYLDSTLHTHDATGPRLTEGQQGTLVIHIGGAGAVQWDAHLSTQ